MGIGMVDVVVGAVRVTMAVRRRAVRMGLVGVPMPVIVIVIVAMPMLVVVTMTMFTGGLLSFIRRMALS